MSNDKYCGTCYGEAEKHGRAVRLTQVYDYPVCSQCESRLRNGLVHVSFSNGTEGYIFRGRCEDCRHNIDNGESIGEMNPPFKCCTHGVLDRVIRQMAEDHDHICHWLDPKDIDNSTCPPTCLRFTHRDDDLGHLRDPAPPDVAGQLTFEDVLEVRERSIVEVPHA